VELLAEMVPSGYRMFAIRGKGEIAAVAGVQVLTNLYYERHLYDLVTATDARLRGHGAAFMSYPERFARREGCKYVALPRGIFFALLGVVTGSVVLREFFLVTTLSGRGVSASSPRAGVSVRKPSATAYQRAPTRQRTNRSRSAPGLPVEDDQPDRHGQPHAHVNPALGLDTPFDGVRDDDHEHAAVSVVEGPCVPERHRDRRHETAHQERQVPARRRGYRSPSGGLLG